MGKNFPALAALLLSVNCLPARQETTSCGTHAYKLQEEVHLHRQAMARGSKRLRRSLTKLSGERMIEGKSVRPDSGNIAILDDADGVVSRRNVFSLNTRRLRFIPSAANGTTSYQYELSENTWDPSTTSGTRLAGLGDDDTREIALPFPFSFYGKQYNSLWLNSDGNVTFGGGDSNSVSRTLGRLSSGLPRIAGLFRDLDPERASATDGVFTQVSGDSFAISWIRVPEYADFGTGPLQTVQLRIFADGSIEISFADITTRDAVVGIAPGRLNGSTSVVSFLNNVSGSYTGAVAERFAGTEEIDIISAAQKFYLNHDDTYDYLVFYNDLDVQADTGAVAYEVTLRNNRTGYGDELVNTGEEAGSARRLQAIMNMGPLSQYPVDPDSRVPARFSIGDTPITTLAHEAGHLFLAFASVRDPFDPSRRPMLGGQASAHWAFTFNSEASLLEGNRIQDSGPGTSPRFLTTATVEGFSPVDQYLMGLRPAEEVPDTFYVRNARGSGTSGFPRVGVAFDGERQDVRVSDLIQVQGRRIPDHTVSQRRFRFAFVLITTSGVEPSAEKLQQLEMYRSRFEQFYNQATSGRASADASLRKSLDLSIWPAAGVIAGGTATATVSLQQPAQVPVTVLLRPATGNVSTPASVIIPAGATQGSFAISGLREGVDEITAEPSDAAFDSAYAKVQVATPQSIRLSVVSGDRQTATPGVSLAAPVQIRVTDANNLPYPGVPVSITLTGGGSVDRTEVQTDGQGLASIRWTPGAEAINELNAQIAGGSRVTATALGRPVLSAMSVVNAASFLPGLTPGGIASIFGANLHGSSTTEVLLNGTPATLFYVSTRQVNFLVPQTLAGGTAELIVRTNAGASTALPIAVQTFQPGVFFDASTGFGAVLLAGTGQVTQMRPVAAGEMIEIYATGLGATQSVGNGNSTTVIHPEVTIGGRPAEVIFSGLAPGFPGLYQINARVPSGIPPGAAMLVVSTQAALSNTVRIQVQ